ncbi:hypothetical protein OCU04_004076 [Sclerotinia nivalis]|uniref:Uncharacterized protein n=1 Tax=Sclerotinia nivalis TaxID=352851 RepID=A0A9X0AT77_9HELO|nr:hypothetical protein OCU04_004076 [Sclerotinia nivalis]
MKLRRRDGILGTMGCNRGDTKRQLGLGMEMEVRGTLQNAGPQPRTRMFSLNIISFSPSYNFFSFLVNRIDFFIFLFRDTNFIHRYSPSHKISLDYFLVS